MKKLIYLTLFAASFLGMALHAQTTCSDFTINTVVTSSTCQSNGTITVTLSGNDASSLFNIQYSLQPTVTGGFSLMPSANNVLSGIPAGSYTVTVSAFCDAAGQYSVVKSKTDVVVGGTYQVPELSFVAAGRSTTGFITPTSRKSYSGCSTGKIVMLLKYGNQTTVPTFTITSAPSGVTIPQTVSVSKYSTGSLSTGYTYTLDGLYPAGDYTVEIDDGCYVAAKSFTLGVLTDIPNPTSSSSMSYTNIYPYLGDDPSCNLINLNITQPTTTTVDFYQYFRDSLYEIGAAPLGGTPTNWTTWIYGVTPTLNLGSNQISDFYGSSGNNTMSVYFRVKNCTDIQERYDLYIFKPNSFSIGYRYHCDKVYTLFKPTTYFSSVYCYPITLKAVNTVTNEVMAEQTGITNPSQIVDSLLMDYNTQYTISITDNSGFVLSQNKTYQPQVIYSSTPNDLKDCDTWQNFYYRDNLYCYPVYVDIKDSTGTTVILDTINSTDYYSPPLQYGTKYSFNFTYPNTIINGSPYTSSWTKTFASGMPSSLTVVQLTSYEGCSVDNGSLRFYTGNTSISWPTGTVFTIVGPSSFGTKTYTTTSPSYNY